MFSNVQGIVKWPPFPETHRCKRPTDVAKGSADDPRRTWMLFANFSKTGIQFEKPMSQEERFKMANATSNLPHFHNTSMFRIFNHIVSPLVASPQLRLSNETSWPSLLGVIYTASSNPPPTFSYINII